MQTMIGRKPFTLNFLLVLLGLLTFAGIPQASAQAFSTDSKTADLSVFGGFTSSSTDYAVQRNKGITAGVDYTRYFHWRVAPSLEVRGNRTTGDVLTQEALLAGVAARSDFHRFHPYADALAGGAHIIFNVAPYPGYQKDTGSVFSLGGGVDVDLVRHFQLKVDFQHESMNFGINGALQPTGDFTLAPNLFTVGVTYRIPFRPYHDQSHHHQ